MKILTTDMIKSDLVDKLKNTSSKNKLILLSRLATKEEDYYKKSIIKRCKEFQIDYIEKEFDQEASDKEIAKFVNSFDSNDGYLLLLPFGGFSKLDYLRNELNIKDLDGFTYKSQGRAAYGEYKGLPATPKAIVKFLDSLEGLEGQRIVIANANNLIGVPLANYLSKKRATVTLINRKTKYPKELIKSSDIFISAIGQAHYYDKSYFKDGQVLIDVGTSEVNGMIIGDINFDDLKDLDLRILTHKKGIGAITTLTLLETLIDEEDQCH